MLLNSVLKNYTYIALISFIGLLLYVFANVPNIPTADEWDLSYFVERFYENKLTMSDLMIPHNECRMPYPHIINLIILFITRWHSFTLISFNLVLLFVFYFTLREYTYESLKPKNINSFGAGFLFILLVIFSFKQYENIVLSFDLNYYLSVIAGLFSFISLKKISWKSVIISIVWAHISMYSYASGFAIWPFLILLVWLISDENYKAKMYYSTMIMLFFMLNIGLYFYEYHPLSSKTIEKSVNPMELVPYAFAFLSNNFTTSSNTAILLSILQLVSIGISIGLLLKNNKAKLLNMAPIFLYGFWAMAVGFMVAHGRASLGITQALSPRYCTLSFPFTIVSILSLVINIDNIGYLTSNKIIQKYISVPLYMFLVLFGMYQVKFISLANQRNSKLEDALACIKASNFESPVVKEMLYPNSELLRQKVELMKKYHLSMYR
ncbi:hypothetical protein [Cellulophaga sp. BC115SP]|uniref:hypothetical protein n=1 Tax=Cellulophaga sp. BC115SP TaxID=2683263 RepID=UPI0014134FE8|nr:hypothetical protein [Cellulophaga sp. BC115SP]NBB27605.1 hypothetical protein [Cellulophaga sp. BC115SP]